MKSLIRWKGKMLQGLLKGCKQSWRVKREGDQGSGGPNYKEKASGPEEKGVKKDGLPHETKARGSDEKRWIRLEDMMKRRCKRLEVL